MHVCLSRLSKRLVQKYIAEINKPNIFIVGKLILII